MCKIIIIAIWHTAANIHCHNSNICLMLFMSEFVPLNRFYLFLFFSINHLYDYDYGHN